MLRLDDGLRIGSRVATAGEAGCGVADVVGYRMSQRARTATIARAAAVEVCEPRQGREAAALSIPSRRRGYLKKSASLREA